MAVPCLADGRAYTFWQLSDRHRLDGYVGEERYMVVNVYARQ